ncbi:DUF2092 domain-containing protein [Dankookia rubra]|nr:DUF2092 domain-containing protein [Dankookia rubra]
MQVRRRRDRLRPLEAMATLALMVGGAALPARAQGLDPAVAEPLRRMSATLAAAPSLTVRLTQLREVPAAPDSDQMVSLGATIAVGLKRDSGVAALVGGDRGSYRLWYDGSTATLLSLTANAYARAALPGDVEGFLDRLELRLGVQVPVRDLLASDSFAALTEPGTTGARIGRTLVNGAPCDHFMLRNLEVDWQIWIAASGQPLPCRLVAIDRKAPGAPRTVLEFQSWNLKAKLDVADFTFVPPPGATELSWRERGLAPSQPSQAPGARP